MSAIPPCSQDSDRCKQLNKLDKMAFVIGFTANILEQSYVAYRYVSQENHNSLQPIESDSEMPFQMKHRSAIRREGNVKNIWTMNSSFVSGKRHNIYLAATYDERDFSIVYIIKHLENVFLHILRLEKMENIIYPMSDLKFNIKSYLGFILRTDIKTGVIKPFAIFVVKENGDKEEVIFEFQPLHNDSTKGTEQHFIAQVLNEIGFDLQ